MAAINTSAKEEELMLSLLLAAAKEFYEKPENQEAFETWRKNKEAYTHGTNYSNV